MNCKLCLVSRVWYFSVVNWFCMLSGNLCFVICVWYIVFGNLSFGELGSRGGVACVGLVFWFCNVVW